MRSMQWQLLQRVNNKFPHELSIVRFNNLTVLYAINPETFSFRNTRHSKIVPNVVLSDYWRVVVAHKIGLGDKSTLRGQSRSTSMNLRCDNPNYRAISCQHSGVPLSTAGIMSYSSDVFSTVRDRPSFTSAVLRFISHCDAAEIGVQIMLGVLVMCNMYTNTLRLS